MVKFELTTTTGTRYSCYVDGKWVSVSKEFITIEELVDYMKKEGDPIIMSITNEGKLRLETYDDYRE